MINRDLVPHAKRVLRLPRTNPIVFERLHHRQFEYNLLVEIEQTCFSAFIPTSRAQPADLILESGSFLAKCGSLGG